jgi:hypothetical protein
MKTKITAITTLSGIACFPVYYLIYSSQQLCDIDRTIYKLGNYIKIPFLRFVNHTLKNYNQNTKLLTLKFSFSITIEYCLFVTGWLERREKVKGGRKKRQRPT